MKKSFTERMWNHASFGYAHIFPSRPPPRIKVLSGELERGLSQKGRLSIVALLGAPLRQTWCATGRGACGVHVPLAVDLPLPKYRRADRACQADPQHHFQPLALFSFQRGGGASGTSVGWMSPRVRARRKRRARQSPGRFGLACRAGPHAAANCRAGFLVDVFEQVRLFLLLTGPTARN